MGSRWFTYRGTNHVTHLGFWSPYFWVVFWISYATIPVFWRYQERKAMRTHATLNEVSKFRILKENDENDSGCFWNIPAGSSWRKLWGHLLWWCRAMSSEVGRFVFFENQTLKLRPKRKMLVCHMLALSYMWSSEIFLLKIWRRSAVCHPLWELQVGNLNYRTISGNRSSVLDVLSLFGNWMVERYVLYRSFWHNLPTSHKNQNHPTIIQQSWKTYHLKHILNIEPESWMHLPKVLPPARPKTWSSTRSWRPGHPKTGEPSSNSAAAVQLRMPVEPCVLGCSQLRMIRDR